MENKINLLVTGGCGFIGSNFINKIFFEEKYNIINLDAMYYCANEMNIIEEIRKSSNYTLVTGDLCDKKLVTHVIEHYQITQVIHFAAQSHVQNSFEDSLLYTRDNILGTHTLLEVCRKYGKIEKFIHVSTDEVYGESMLEVDEQHKTEHSILCPTNPYAATKAGAEIIAQSYHHSFKMPIIITRGNNVYGPNQYPEKLVPRFIQLLQENKKVTIQGKGNTVRAFLHVDDTVEAFKCILENGKIGEIYNIGCDENMEYSVLDVAKILIKMIKKTEDYDDWIEYIEDRPYNDLRYYISNQKLKKLGWEIKTDFKKGLEELVWGKYKINSEYLDRFDDMDIGNYFGKWINDISVIDKYQNSHPIKHVIIENFLDSDYAEKLFNEFPTNFDDSSWHKYMNPIEVKYANDHLETMGKHTKDLFYVLSHKKLIDIFSKISGISDLEYDPYLHGAGLHAHPRHGRLNLHLDYEKHPITGKERRMNIILYLSKDWKNEWNGATELWDENVQNKVVESKVKFNSAIIFQTNEISWHGLPEKIMCPEGVFRKSFAYYYVSPLKAKENNNKFGADNSGYRTKASFIKRPTDPNLKQMDELYKIRPHRRIAKNDMKQIWPEWTPKMF